MSDVFAEWHYQERKLFLWCGIKSKTRNRLLYAIPLCEAYTPESDRGKITKRGRMAHFEESPQQYEVTLSKTQLKARWPSRAEFFYQVGILIAWIAENCREEPWSLQATSVDEETWGFDEQTDSINLNFSFANEVAAVAFKFVWQ